MPEAADADAPTASQRAWSWVTGQRGSGTTVTTSSVIQPTQTYSTSWTGAVGGTFTPQGASTTVTTPQTSLVVDSPASVPANYAGVVTGHITGTPAQNRWIVQVYRDTAAGRQQEPVQALVAADGTFSINLGAVSAPPAGTWALGLLDANNGYAPSGTAWPAVPTYDNWQIKAYVVTDTAYLVATEPARTDGTFSFPNSQPGTKMFQLVNTSTGAVLAEASPDFGEVRSFTGGTQVFSYDQAVATIAAIGLGDSASAATLTRGLLALQRGDGGFPEAADVRNPAGGAPIERSGICAIATYALLRQAEALGPNGSGYSTVLAAARAGVAWLAAQQRSDGLIGAGLGDYRSDGSLDASAKPAWVSTEHNLDAWQTFHLAAAVLGDSADTTAAAAVATGLTSTLWMASPGRFAQGLAPDGSLDTTDPLDVNSWGVLFLHAVGRDDLATQAMAHVNAFASQAGGISGYRAYYPQSAFLNAPANVWSEGTAGVALARTHTGASAASQLSALASMQSSDGGLDYAMVADAPTSMVTAESVAGTAWFVLAGLPAANSIWN